MPLIRAQGRLTAWKKATRFVAIVVSFLAAVGFLFDLFFGLPLLRSSRSWTAWILGIGGLGVLYLLGEGAGEWISARDKVSHPLWKRAWHLALLLGLGVLVATLAGTIIRMTR
jgi:hypothetical protein